MSRRVFIIAIALVFGFCFIGSLCRTVCTVYSHHDIMVHIDWEAYKLPVCSASTTTNCVISLNVIAFAQDGSVTTIANNVAPTTTSVDTLLPVGSYDFWLVVSGRDSKGSFTTSDPGTYPLTVTRKGVVVDNPVDTDDDDTTPPSSDDSRDKI